MIRVISCSGGRPDEEELRRIALGKGRGRGPSPPRAGAPLQHYGYLAPHQPMSTAVYRTASPPSGNTYRPKVSLTSLKTVCCNNSDQFLCRIRADRDREAVAVVVVVTILPNRCDFDLF